MNNCYRHLQIKLNMNSLVIRADAGELKALQINNNLLIPKAVKGLDIVLLDKLDNIPKTLNLPSNKTKCKIKEDEKDKTECNDKQIGKVLQELRIRVF